MKKKLLVLMLLAVVTTFAAACGGGDGDAVTGPVAIPADWTPETGANLVLPLTTDNVTFRIWGAEGGTFDAGLDAISDSPWYQELMRRTGINIEWMHPPTGGEQENLNLLIAAGDLPDVLNIMGTGGGAGMLQGGMSLAIQDGFILEVTELVQTFAPYYWELIHENELRRMSAFTDEGMLPGFWQVNVLQPPWYGLITRQDWLDELGIGMPITYDDWRVALRRFRDELGADAPMIMHANGFLFFDTFHAGFNTTPGFYQVNGQVQFGPLGQGFREYLEMMHEWFMEGLIDPDFASANFFFGPDAMTTTGRSGLFPHMYVMFPVLNTISPDDNFRAVAVPPPVRYVGQTIHRGQQSLHTEWIMLITNQNPDPVLFTRLMNYLYSPEGTMFANWGIEGQHFNFDADGNPRFTAYMYDNPNDWSLHNVQRRYTRFPSGGWFYDWRRELTPGISEDVYNAPTIWETNVDFAWNMPPVTLTADESAENARIMTDVNTHRDEMVARFITGAEPLANFDTFVQTLRNMGIERAMELQQAALDRFFAR